jgi:hydroxymethylpyrimidine/phosphomethylpyrimidine kinase
MIPNVLSIAGTDPSGGAGIQADLKTFAALGAYGMAAVTAVVAQNTTGVQAVHQLPADFVAAQIDSVFADIRVDAVKIGMLGPSTVVEAVAAALRRWQPPFVVLDPVMVAKSGDRLLAADAVAALRDELLPLVHVITPNLPEAADLLGEAEAVNEAEMADQALRLQGLGARGVLLKGGHLDGAESADLLVVDGESRWLRTPRVATANTHGTGCTLSSAIAALVPQRSDVVMAVAEAKDYLTAALRAADELDVGHGHGPVHHFHALWGES